MTDKLHVLVVDDDIGFIEDFTLLSGEIFQICTAKNGRQALSRLASCKPDAVILDLCLGNGMDGLEILKKIKEDIPEIPVIMVTEHASVETAVEAMKLGAVHYMPKHPNMKTLHAIIERELSSVKWKYLYQEAVYEQFGELIGSSPVMRELYKKIDAVAKTGAAILIEGESGTGKELVAREIHKRSRRHDQPFVAVNCAAIPSTLFESELFGHERGAFTGAAGKKVGKFELAHMGTLFLDEVASLSMELQAKLLRVIEQGEITRLGGNSLVKTDVRILSAANQPLEEAMRNGQFREDLFYRLNGIDIQVPPLRERADDILRLADHFNTVFGNKTPVEKRFSEEALNLLKKYHWPGNVRELRNAIERVHIIVQDRKVEAEDLQLKNIAQPDIIDIIRSVMNGPYEAAKRSVLSEFQKIYFKSLLKKNNGNVTQAAREANIPRQSMYRYIKDV